MQELAARREIDGIGMHLVQQARQDLGASTSGERPSVVDPGSFLALILPSIGRPLANGGQLDDMWASAQATTFILAGGYCAFTSAAVL